VPSQRSYLRLPTPALEVEVMENPASWKTAELIIRDTLEDHALATSRGAVGYSSAAAVANALRRAGLLSDQDEPHIGWDKLRAHLRKRAAERRGSNEPV
jgi:hypothetical protein